MLEARVKERTEELEQAQLEILHRLSRAADFRDDDTMQHTERVGRLSAALARELGHGRGRRRAAAAGRAAARPRQDRGARQHPAQGRRPQRRRVHGGQDAHADRRAPAVGQHASPAADGRGDRPHAPRAVGRLGLPAGPARRRHPPGQPHRGRRRRLRRPDARPRLQEVVATLRSARGAESPEGPAVRSRRRRRPDARRRTRRVDARWARTGSGCAAV